MPKSLTIIDRNYIYIYVKIKLEPTSEVNMVLIDRNRARKVI